MQLRTCVQAAPVAGFDVGQTSVVHCQVPWLQVHSPSPYRHRPAGETQRPPLLGAVSGQEQTPNGTPGMHAQFCFDAGYAHV